MIDPAAPLPEGFTVTVDTVPQSIAELDACLASWEWRIFSGQLYKITTKGDDAPEDEPEIAVPFIPNAPQRELLADLHNRNDILKARQMGFSTLIEILGLDQALFNRDQEVVVIAHTKDAATKLYRKKVCFAYDNLPPYVRDMIPTAERSQTQMVFANGSSIEVTSSARGGTPHFLHISEFGKIAAKFPEKATEITTGSMQGVPKSGFIFIESTAEGQAGAFYDLTKRAEALRASGKPLLQTEFRFHFFGWFQMPEYREDPAGVVISAKNHEYFDRIEGEMGVAIDLDQRAWYVSKRDNEFSSTPELMWREYPSTPSECWMSSNEGKYYHHVLMIARREARIGSFPFQKHLPVNSFWDVGASDHTAVWLHQRIQSWDRWIRYREAQLEGYLPQILWMESLGCVWGTHFLPHDASHQHKGIEDTKSAVQKLREIRPSWDWRIVPRIGNIQHGIDLVRLDFPNYQFDEEGCKEGIARLDNYQREWNTRLQCWGQQPRHDDSSHGADALRQKAQGYEPNDKAPRGASKTRARRSGMTA